MGNLCDFKNINTNGRVTVARLLTVWRNDGHSASEKYQREIERICVCRIQRRGKDVSDNLSFDCMCCYG